MTNKTQKRAETAIKPPVTRDALLQAALREADALGWDLMTMRDIALAADCTLADVQAHFIDKFDVLVAFGRFIDNRTLKALGEADERLNTRERLFEGLMARFDVMQDHRAIISGLAKNAVRDPKQVLFSVPELARSMAWLLEQAGVDTGGLRGLARVGGLTAVYLSAVRVWLDDESPDMGKTMAAIDKGLGHAERWAERAGL